MKISYILVKSSPQKHRLEVEKLSVYSKLKIKLYHACKTYSKLTCLYKEDSNGMA